MEKRGRIDIIYDMLVALRNAKNGLKKTRLMYKANLIHKQLQLYLKELEKGKMITIDKHITITDKGLMYITKIEGLREFEKTFAF